MSVAQEEQIKAGGTAAVPAYDRKAWEKGYKTARAEENYELEVLAGAIPADLEGTYFRNGPANFEAGKEPFKHIFDGDGMVTAVTLREGRAYYRNRFVRTSGYEAERKAGKRIFRGFHDKDGGLLANIFDTRVKNVANTNVLHWAGRLFATCDAGGPYRLDPKSLDTLGLSDLGGVLKPGEKFSPHPCIDAERGRLVAFGSTGYELTLYEFDKAFRLLGKRKHKMNGFSYMHDFLITKNWAVFYRAPMTFDVASWAAGLAPLSKAMAFDRASSGDIILIPRNKPDAPVVSIPAPARFAFHMANAFEDSATGEVVFEMGEAEDFILGKDDPAGRPQWEYLDFSRDVPVQTYRRYRVDVASRTFKVEDVLNRFTDMFTVAPSVVGKPHRYVYGTAAASAAPAPLQGVVKIDSASKTDEVWFPEPWEYCGEPTFAGKKGAAPSAAEDDGYLLSLLFNGRTEVSELLIFDAKRPAAGPLCRLAIRSNVPLGLHGIFVSELATPFDQIEKSFALTNLFKRKGWNVANSDFSSLGLSQWD